MSARSLRPAALGLALALAGCAGAPRNPQQAACESQADDSPAVRDLRAKMAGTGQLQIELQPQLANAKKQATLACLRQRGLAPPGGVQAPKRSNTLFNGLF